MKLIEHEIPFLPESRALKYFEAEHQILEQFFTFLALNPELDGHQTINRAFYKLVVMSSHLKDQLESVISPESLKGNLRVDQDLVYAEIHKPWNKVKIHEKSVNWEVGPRRRKLLFMRNRRFL